MGISSPLDAPGAGSSSGRASRAGIAVAGFVCGLVSFAIALAFTLNYAAFFVLPPSLGARLNEFESRGHFIIVVVAIQLATVPLALGGVILGVLGLRSLSRRWMARIGVALSIIALLPSAVLITVIIVTLQYCSLHQCI